MDPKTLNALVHDREAAFYDDRFLIDYDARIGREVRRELRRVIGAPTRARRALDVACGTGYLAIGLAAADLADEVHGCDLSFAMLERTRANAGARAIPLSLCDAERLPYADSSFDLVVARGALHHVPEPLAAMREIRRVLEPGGTAVVLAEPTPGGERQVGAVVGVAVRVVEALKRIRGTESDHERHHWELASIAANLHTFDPEEIATLAEKAGFEDITVGTASWAWILTLGLNYYLVGEFEALARNRVVRRLARAAADSAALFDRVVADRLLTPEWRHTIQAVMR
jgi:ubiquinone/menaquinone biosynthesis C-methylase UbiE